MAEGTTLERLQVVIEAKAEAYKKEIDAVKAKTEKVTAAVNKCTERIHDAVNKVTTGPAGKEIDALTNKLNKQTEAINAQTAKVENLRNKLDALNRGEARNSAVSALESQLKKAEKELAAADKQMQPLLDKLTEMENLQPKVNVEKYRAEAEEIARQTVPIRRMYDDLTEHAQQLKQQLREAQLNPNAAAQIRSLKEELRQAGKEISIVKAKLDPLAPLEQRGRELAAMYALQGQTAAAPHASEVQAVSDKIAELEPEYERLENHVDTLRRKLEAARMNPESTADVQKLTSELELAAQKLDRLRGEAAQTQERLEKAGSGGASGMERFRKAMSSASTIMDKVKKKIDGVTAALHKHKSASDGCRFSADKLSKSIFRLGNMFKLMLIRQTMRAIIEGGKQGFQNLAQYSDITNQSLSLLMSSLTQLKNAFAVAVAPMLNAFAPALNMIIQLAVTAANAIGQLFAALTGKGTVVQAVGVNEDYAASLDKTGSAAKKAAKDIKNATLGIDELNVIQQKQDSGGGAGGISPSDMFETVEVEGKYKDLAKKIKDIMSKLFRPFKEAWNREGKFVMDSWKYALNEVKKLFSDIGRDFLEVWNQEETIQMFADILHIVGDIGLIVGNLAKNFRDAWNENRTGFHILENIRDIFATIIRNIRIAADYTVKWADNLDFSPVMEAFERFTASLQPVVDNLSKMLSDFYVLVLLPIAKWSLEEGLPKFLDVLTSFNEKVDWEKIRGNLSKFWQKLEPFAEAVGEGLILFLQRFSDLVADVLNSDWLAGILEAIGNALEGIEAEDVADAIESLAKAFLLFKAGSAAAKAVSFLATNMASLQAMGIVVAGITLVMTGFEAIEQWKEDIDYINEKGFKNWQGNNKANGKFSPWNIYDRDPNEANSLTGVKTPFLSNEGGFNNDLVKSPFDIKGWIGDAKKGITEWQAGNRKAREEEQKQFNSWFSDFEKTCSSTLDNIKGYWSEKWDGVEVWFETNVAPWFTAEKWSETYDSMKTSLSTKWGEITDWWNNTAIVAWWEESVAPWFTAEKWTELYENIRLALETKWNEITEWWNSSALVVWWEESVAPWFTAEKWSGILQNIKTSFKTKWDETVGQWKIGIDAWWKQHVEPWFTKKKWQELGENLKNGIYEGFKGLANKVVDILNGVISSLEGMINSAVKGINDLLAKINQTSLGEQLGWDFQIGNVSFGRIPQFAAGGFPDTGSLFIANEAGPELVGTMGGRTAVAPEASITQGIEEAAYQGMKRALSEESIGGMLIQLIDVVKEGKIIEADGREIAAVVNDRNARNGIVFT